MRYTRSFSSRLPVTLGAIACVLAPLSALAQDAKPLLFVSNRGDNKMKFNVYSMKPDGSDQKNLTKSDMMEFDPAFSPDGKTIVFIAVKISEKQGAMPEGGLFTMNADGSERKKLVEFKGLGSTPVFSPDGKKIAFTSFALDLMAMQPPKFSLQVIDADGKNKKEVGEGIVSGWSPDGKQLLVTRIAEGEGFDPFLYIMDADGKNAKKLSDGKAMFATFSPDGKKIACIAEVGGDQPDLIVMNADGSDRKQLTKTEDVELAPQWSPDGKSLYFTRFPKNLANPLEANVSIFRIDADGKNEKALTMGKGMNAMTGCSLFLAFATQQQGGAIEEGAAKPEEAKKP